METITINVYDAGPAVFDYSNLNDKGERDPNVIGARHQAIADQLAKELSDDRRTVNIRIVFPSSTHIKPSERELANRHLLSSRIANSCEDDIRRCEMMVADVSPWPKKLAGGTESVMSDEGTVYELGYAAGLSDSITRLMQMAKGNHIIAAALPAMLKEMGLPKIVVPYNTSTALLEERMADHYAGTVYEKNGLHFSMADHTQLEECGDKNNAMVANAPRKQGFEPQPSFELALRTGVERYLDTRRAHARSTVSR